jgi:lipoprotein-releasing system ATP-binding protein
MTTSDIILEARGLRRDLGGEVKTPVLRGVDLAVRRGEFVALTGASGSGKSTLLYLLGALDRPTAGEILLNGVSIGALDDDARAKMRGERFGFVFQFHFLLQEFTVLENVMMPLRRRGALRAKEIEERAMAALTSLGLGDLAQRTPSQLSGGQQQRVSIARAVANDPDVILADEPTGNLDSKNGVVVMEVFEKLVREQKRTIVMVTHERAFARRASRRVELADGAVVADVDQTRPEAA